MGISQTVREHGISGSSSSLAENYLQRADVGCDVGGSVYRVLCGARVLLLGRGQQRVCTTGARRSSGRGRGRTVGGGRAREKQRPHFDLASLELVHTTGLLRGGADKKVTSALLLPDRIAGCGPARTRSGRISAKSFLCCVECF